jgi:hypothetical protein
LASNSLNGLPIDRNTPFPENGRKERRRRKVFAAFMARYKKKTRHYSGSRKNKKQCLYYWSTNPILVVGYKACCTIL